MNSKRIVSLILSIVMTLQIFVFQTPVHAMEGANLTIQKSEGQKINERTEEFAFKNTKKPKFTWFIRGSQPLFGARDASTTKTETLKITTTATGLDDGDKPFDWAAFGQNRKFKAWIEVAYVEDKQPGEKVATQRHKVSKEFDISGEGDINTTATLDASKTVDYYFLKTEYDTDDAAFRINAVLEYAGSLSPQKTNNLEFNVDIHQIVSTKITYNLIDEYGKAIDLTDTKEEKPADADLANLGKIGDVTTFNLKNEGTEILWQDQELDEFNLMDSSLTMSLTKNEIKSNNIDYKLSSTYDKLDGGKVTIQRQKDVVTPKDPQNPGNIPEGYARLNLSADATGAGPKGTFNKDDDKDNCRVVDVKAGKDYTTAQAEVNKVTKPFPLTSKKKVDTGKTFDKWTPELGTLGTAVAKDTKNLNATYKSSDKEIIPYLPTEPVPTEDENGLPIPSDYVTVTFKSEDAEKGKVKIGTGKEAKVGAIVLAKVKPGINLSKKAEITTVPETNYGFTKWDPILGKAAADQTYTAYFVKSGSEIKENDPIPDGWFKVTVSQDKSIVDNTVETKSYTVKPNDTLAADKFADIKDKAKDGYKDPAWYVGSEKIANPSEKPITTSTDFLARATELESNKIKKNGGLKAVDITAFKGDSTDGKFWNKGVALNTANEDIQKLLDAATVNDQSGRTTAEAGEKVGTLKVTFSDGSTIEVSDQKLIVKDTKVDINFDKKANDDANAPRHNEEVVKGRITTTETVDGAIVEVQDTDGKSLGRGFANADGTFNVGTKRPLKAGEDLSITVTLPEVGRPSDAVTKKVGLNPDELNSILPTADKLLENLKGKPGISKDKLDKLEKALKSGKALIDEKTKKAAASVKVDSDGQKSLDEAFAKIKKAMEDLTENQIPTINGPDHKEIFVGGEIDLDEGVTVADDKIKQVEGKDYSYKIYDGSGTEVQKVAMVAKDGVYRVVYSAEDAQGVKASHTMTVVVKKTVIEVPGEFPEKTPEGYVKVEFKSGDNAGLNGVSKFLVKKDASKSEVKEPTIIPKEGYKVADPKWSVAIPDTFANNFETTAQVLEKATTTEPDQKDKDKYAKLTFEAGDHGKFKKDAQTTIYVLKSEEVKFNTPKVNANDGFTFAKWDPELKTSYEKDTKHVAQYASNSDISDVPVKDFQEVKFVSGTDGNFGKNGETPITTKSFWVRPGKLVDLRTKSPKVTVTATGKSFVGWDQDLVQTFTKAQDPTVINAKYDDTVKTEEPKENKEKYAKVDFVAGNLGTIAQDATKTYWVVKDAKVTLTPPTVTAKGGWKVKTGNDAWSPEVATKYTKDTIHVAQYDYDGASVVPQKPGEDKPAVPDNFVKVEFKKGDHGVISSEENFIYWVDPTKEVEVKAPTVIANTGYIHDGWNPQVPTGKTTFEQAKTYTATYKNDEGISETPKAGYIKITFDAGDNGKIAGNRTKVFYVNPEVEVTLKAPEVTPNSGYKFKAWDETVPTKATKFTEAKTFTAQYENDDDISETPKKGYTPITFDAGLNGTIAGNRTKTLYVNPVKEVTITAPQVTANAGYTFKEWKPALPTEATKFTEAKTYTAEYNKGDDYSTEKVEGFIKVSFNAGDHGNFGITENDPKTEIKTKNLWVRPDTPVDLTKEAPKVTPNAGWVQNGWSRSLVVKVNDKSKDEDKTITAKYIEDTAVSETEKPGYTKITFKAGEHGDFGTDNTTPVTEKNIWLNPEKKIKLSDLAPKVIANINWTFDKWMDGKAVVDLETEKAYAETKEFTAAYKSNVIDDEKDIPADDKDNFVKITFAPGEGGKFAEGAKTSTNVRKSVVVDITDKAPAVTANEGKTFTGWDSELKRAFDAATTITAKYTDSISDKPVEGWTEILFNSGEHGRFENGTKNTVWVNPEKAVALDKVMKDKLVPYTNYSFDKWTGDQGADVDLATPKMYKKSAQFTAVYKSNIIDDEKDIPAAEKDNFVKITFDPGKDGKFDKDAKTTTNVRKNVAVDLTEKAPTVIPNQGYGHSGWKPALKGTFTTATKITAQYKEGTFNENAINEITVLGPTKMSYNQGEELKLAGLKVIAKDDAGMLKTYEGADAITKAGFTIAPADKTPLTKDHNNKPIKVTKGKVNGETVTTLAVYENKSAEPTDVLARNLGKNPEKTTVTGKAPKDSVIKITDINGNDLTDGTEIKVGENGEFKVELKYKLEPGTPVKVTSTEPGKTESSPVVKQVFDDENKDGKPDEQTPTPTIEFAANQNTAGSTGQATETAKQKTTVKFTVKNKPTTVYVRYTVDGEAKEETFEIGANDELTKTVDLFVKLPVGAEVQVLAKDADKTLSKAATAKVVRDANNDGTADNKTLVGKTEIDPIKAESEKITVKPADNATELVIKETDKSGNTPEGSKEITVKKGNDGNWTIDGKTVEKDGDKLVIPTKDKLKLDEYNVVEVESKGDPDTTTPSNARATVGEAADIEAPATPKVDQPVDGDKDIKVKTPTEKDAKTITVEVDVKGKPGETSTKKTVEVTKDDDGKWKTKDGKDVPEENGKLVIPVDPAVKTGDKVTVEVADETGNSSKTQPQEVVERQQLPEPTINPIKTGEKTVAGTAKDATSVDIYKKVGDNYELIKEGVGVNSDGTYNYPGTTEFKDGDVIRVVAKKSGMTEAAAETTVGVDTTALDKAIQDGNDALNKTNDGTPEDKALEKAIKDAEDLKKKTDPKPPTQEELNNAQKEIEKAIENKKKTDEERQKLKDIIKEAEEETQKDGYKDKPAADRRALEKAIKEGKENLKNNTNITESTTKIEKALEEIRKELLRVGVNDARLGDESITISTYPSFCSVEVFVNKVSQGVITTNSFGNYRFTLNGPIKSGDEVELKATKDGYKDGKYWDRIN